MISKIDELVKKVQHTATLLYMNKLAEVDSNLAELFPEIKGVYLEVIDMGIKNSEFENQIPTEILISQLKNLIEAYNAKDIIMLADTLEHEITNGLLFCREIFSGAAKE